MNKSAYTTGQIQELIDRAYKKRYSDEAGKKTTEHSICEHVGYLRAMTDILAEL